MSTNLQHDQAALLAESEERYRTLIESSFDLIQSVRPDGTFEFVNKTWLDKMGYTWEELTHMHVWDVIQKDSLPTCMVHFKEALGGNSIGHLTAVFQAKDGTIIPLEGDARSRVLDGKVIATHSFFRDITERLRAEELQQRNEKLEREQQARYLEKMAALGKLSAGLSHELNNPAAAAQRAVQLLEDAIGRRNRFELELAEFQLGAPIWQQLARLADQCFEDCRDASERSPLETSRLEDEMETWLDAKTVPQPWNLAPVLVEANLSIADLETIASELPARAIVPAMNWIGETRAIQNQSQVIATCTSRISELVGAVKSYSFRDQAIEQTVDIHDGLDDTITILAYRLRGSTVVRHYDRSLPKIATHGSSLNQVWTNILDNAVDATDGHGTITITTTGRPDSIVVEISDNGSGISEEDKTRIFEPFYTTKPQGSGTGLGLDIVWQIITEDHHGSIEVESEPGNTTFRIILPITAESARVG